ncbi:hypothetical protein Moror_16831 [Moniliophthora roreri MCA 2997]|uniref:Uncharacterized protein n=1 Tax=Moniliophthora roreri (strain MCA 2997) TaxID=1381753 RepID=V2YDJ8_MONRO|nr:hypothetical protein Moror_16831 [Moniliophthora roreri MCA 2997]
MSDRARIRENEPSGKPDADQDGWMKFGSRVWNRGPELASETASSLTTPIAPSALTTSATSLATTQGSSPSCMQLWHVDAHGLGGLYTISAYLPAHNREDHNTLKLALVRARYTPRPQSIVILILREFRISPSLDTRRVVSFSIP